ncbi:MAG TPA: RecX family transcriptional regulator [Bacteroidetes bacterium]|mgnify:FL=1|nr:RecX family transcriptional regulator [Bacteroidota bacterium]
MEEYSKIRYTPSQAKSKIAKFCAYQERCHQEVRDKLYGYGLAKEDVELLIYELIQHDFLNEERFAIAYVRGKFIHKKWGRNKIRMELKKRKISDYCIKKGMQEIEEDRYEEVLLSLLNKKIDSLKAIKGYQKNYKAAQFVMNKGYEGDIVWALIKAHFPEKQ